MPEEYPVVKRHPEDRQKRLVVKVDDLGKSARILRVLGEHVDTLRIENPFPKPGLNWVRAAPRLNLWHAHKSISPTVASVLLRLLNARLARHPERRGRP